MIHLPIIFHICLGKGYLAIFLSFPLLKGNRTGRWIFACWKEANQNCSSGARSTLTESKPEITEEIPQRLPKSAYGSLHRAFRNPFFDPFGIQRAPMTPFWNPCACLQGCGSLLLALPKRIYKDSHVMALNASLQGNR